MARETHLKLSGASEEEIAAALDGQMPEAEEPEADDQPKDEAKPPKIFKHAYSVESLGKMLIKQNYPKLQSVRVAYAFVSEASMSAGEPVIMKAQKVAGLNAWLAQLWTNGVDVTEGPGDPFFLIVVAESIWLEMSHDAKAALLDQVLWTCDVRETGALYIRKPDVQTSVDIVHRHGLFTNKLKDMGQVAKKYIDQPELPVAS